MGLELGRHVSLVVALQVILPGSIAFAQAAPVADEGVGEEVAVGQEKSEAEPDQGGDTAEVAAEVATEVAGEAASAATDDALKGATPVADDLARQAGGTADDVAKHAVGGAADDVAKHAAGSVAGDAAKHGDDIFKILRRAIKPVIGAAIGGTFLMRLLRKRKRDKLYKEGG